MKVYKYLIAYEVNIGTETEPVYKTFYTEKITTNEETAKKEAYKGEYTIEDDGQPEPEPTPSDGDSAVWYELDEAYQKGVDSV